MVIPTGKTVVIDGVTYTGYILRFIHPPVHLPAWPDGDRSSRLVLIARGLAGDEIESSLLAFQQLAGLSGAASVGSIGASNV